MDSHEKDQLFQRGLEAFNSAHFYDAHELWEEVWLKTRNPEKMFLQGLIQVAAAFHHYSRANRLGAHRLLQAGLTKIGPFHMFIEGLNSSHCAQRSAGGLRRSMPERTLKRTNSLILNATTKVEVFHEARRTLAKRRTMGS